MDKIQEIVGQTWAWIEANVLVMDVLGQLVLLVILGFASHFIAKFTNKKLTEIASGKAAWAKLEDFVDPLYFPAILLALVLISASFATLFGFPENVLKGAATLIVAWIFIRLFTRFIKSQRMARALTVLVVSIAGLEIAKVLDPLIEILQGFSITFGETTVSAYDVIWGLLTLVIFVWVALALSRLIEGQLKPMRSINPSLKVLLTKISKIVLIFFAILISLNTMGIDLTALAVFGGALGVGLGFGLQKVVSNFISGVILLMDRSIKPGDVIEIQETFGSINKLAARYTSVITRDGTEFLIPNEDMITQPVINWSHTNRIVRRKIPVSVAYKTDLYKAREIMNEAALSHDRVLREPKPITHVKAFGDNGVELELRFWINDPEEGVTNISSEVMLSVWDAFHDAGIEFPFPQRVLHYAKNSAPAKKTPVKKKKV